MIMVNLKFTREFLQQLHDDIVIFNKYYISDELTAVNEEDVIILNSHGTEETPHSRRVIQERRSDAKYYHSNRSEWSAKIYNVILDIIDNVPTIQCDIYLNPLRDYITHLFYFSQVAEYMASKGEIVISIAPNGSKIHDIDKLDPILLTGYAERFDDMFDTNLWFECMNYHVTRNPHHQEHAIWSQDSHVLCPDLKTPIKDCMHCESIRNLAIKEMVCDKVSRRVQKELSGNLGPDAWDIESKWFTGLPPKWLFKVFTIISKMR